MSVQYAVGDALALYPTLPAGSVDLVMTSPPFLNLRNYLSPLDPLKAAEIGRGSPAAFIDTLLEHVAAWRTVLAEHGTIVIELGDTYSGSGGAGGDYNTGMRKGARYDGSARTPEGWPMRKSKAMIPELLGVALAYGLNPLTGEASPAGTWRIRNVVTWCRSNPPVGATGDKFRIATSSIIVACQSTKRFFDMEPVRTTAPPLDYWELNVKRTKLHHFASYPGEVCRIPILSMSPQRVCRTCGEPSRRVMRTQCYRDGEPIAGVRMGTVRGLAAETGISHTRFTTTRVTEGWSDCGHDDWRAGCVLDPFAGTGTTLAVADLLGRDAVGFDIDSRGPEMYARRHQEICVELFGSRWQQLQLGA